jgi:hypothetical protein
MLNYRYILYTAACIILSIHYCDAQNRYELNSHWKYAALSTVHDSGTILSKPSYPLSDWDPAVVPGTVLTSLLANGKIPDPYYGMNNERIPDIYKTGNAYYTYWFVNEFKELPVAGRQTWLSFRGINYSCEIYLNGHKVNAQPYKGMFLRKSFNITSLLARDGNNRLAVLVLPGDHPGNPNGGQGGDGTIARDVATQYTAGWDWIQPIRDRNTGIWDKVYIERTGPVNLVDPHVVTTVPGVRFPDEKQAPAIINVSADLENTSEHAEEGWLEYQLQFPGGSPFRGGSPSMKVVIPAHTKMTVSLPVLTLQNPKLWWPSGYGAQDLYTLQVRFRSSNQTISDSETVRFGIRQIDTRWNTTTGSREILVNGQRIFIKGGNWIVSDAMLRFSAQRYDAEIRFHRDMNLNLIRVWGGALVERPEFYEACDRYGLLVFQDFWMSGDCNGRWMDPMKLEDQWTRRNYPDDHALYLASAADMIRMVRNHPSLAIWCAGNEITPPGDILAPLRDSIMPALDGTRWLVPYSNADEMSQNTLGGNGDGPYGIQPPALFWEHRTFPFNSEVGSVGLSDYESLQRFIPKENLIAPKYIAPAVSGGRGKEETDSVWKYHLYHGVGYDHYLLPYGEPTDAKDFTRKAQLVNYEQYRALAEGFSAHIWQWYTGVIIWKTQNPWTAMRGQMYDYYLDPNACLYGLHEGSEPLHIMYNPDDGELMLVNNHFKGQNNLMLVVKKVSMTGRDSLITQVLTYIGGSMSKKLDNLPTGKALGGEQGAFLSLQLLDEHKKVVSDNLYWLTDKDGHYSGLQTMNKAALNVQAKLLKPGSIEVTLTNAGNQPVAFFNRLSLVNATTRQRVLPVFYSDNYVSVLPGGEKKIQIDYSPAVIKELPMVSVSGWNVDEQILPVAH